ncbi:hypothetical protein [Acetobacter orientalis]|uniref:hypothetical protein n=1 Tax=Acetobacter orientalis TaxID=146474 RepID=UPI0039ED9AC3
MSQYDEFGFDENGIHKKTGTKYDEEWFMKDGFDCTHHDREGYDRRGYDRQGYDRQGFSEVGFDRHGYDREGFNRAGWRRFGTEQERPSRYND